VLKEMKDYWGGMLKLGATSFWEEYNPTKKGTEHLAMYGRKFGKSLCHAWGASPIYLLGKYYLGVKPTSSGYATYVAEPNLGGLQWMQGKVPTPNGDIDLYCTKTQIKIKAIAGQGTLRLGSKIKPTGEGVVAVPIGKNLYNIAIQPGDVLIVDYKAL
jgi:alpha-L-rhamnosidase